VGGSPFYTGQGDDGSTGLLGPGRVPKYDPRPETCGAVDEAQAALGLARAAGCTPATGRVILAVQRQLHTLMAEVAAAGQADSPFAGAVTAGQVEQLEGWLAEFGRAVEMPKEFVVPGDSAPGAALHLARTVVRRAERRAARLAGDGLLGNEQLVRYLNRLSSLLFVLALFEDQARGSQGPTLARET
jgi:cob(I)alamin adenosyltransferase